jgi:hypothetical protein
MNYLWVLSTYCCGFSLGAIVPAIPRSKAAIELPLFRNGTHGIALWGSSSAPLRTAGMGQIKTGSTSRGERIAKCNRFLEIERELGAKTRYADATVYDLWHASVKR